MGIKKDVFLRDLVRAVTASTTEKYASVKRNTDLFFKEIEPAYNNANGNPDRATNLVFTKEQLYPELNKTEPIRKKAIEDLLNKYWLLGYASNPDRFISELSASHNSLFKLLKPSDIQYIKDVIQTKDYEGIIEDLYAYFKRLAVRSFFEKFDEIRARAETSAKQPEEDVNKSYILANRVVLSYLNSLDQGI